MDREHPIVVHGVVTTRCDSGEPTGDSKRRFALVGGIETLCTTTECGPSPTWGLMVAHPALADAETVGRVSLSRRSAVRLQEGAADRAEYYPRNRQAVADPVLVRRRPHSRSRTEGRLGSESSIGANMSRRNICRHRTRPICQSQIGRPDNSSSSCPAGAGPAGRAGLRLQLQD